MNTKNKHEAPQMRFAFVLTGRTEWEKRFIDALSSENIMPRRGLLFKRLMQSMLPIDCSTAEMQTRLEKIVEWGLSGEDVLRWVHLENQYVISTPALESPLPKSVTHNASKAAPMAATDTSTNTASIKADNHTPPFEGVGDLNFGMEISSS